MREYEIFLRYCKEKKLKLFVFFMIIDSVLFLMKRKDLFWFDYCLYLVCLVGLLILVVFKIREGIVYRLFLINCERWDDKGVVVV